MSTPEGVHNALVGASMLDAIPMTQQGSFVNLFAVPEGTFHIVTTVTFVPNRKREENDEH